MSARTARTDRAAQTRAAVRAQEARDDQHATLSTSEPSAYQRLREHLAYLEMTAAAEHLADELDRGMREKVSATQVLERLLAIEADATRARRLRGRLRFARYPIHKTLAEFDLDFQPSLDRKVLAELSTLRFVEERRNVILLGPPGVGKATWRSPSASPPPKPATERTSPLPPISWPTCSLRISRAAPVTRCALTPGRRFWWSMNLATCRSIKPPRTGSSRW